MQKVSLNAIFVEKIQSCNMFVIDDENMSVEKEKSTILTTAEGPRGLILLQDYKLIEKQAHFNCERIPEKVVHFANSDAYAETLFRVFRIFDD